MQSEWFGGWGTTSDDLDGLTCAISHAGRALTYQRRWWARYDNSTALISAANTRNWKAALVLLKRGADWRRSKSVNGMPFRNLVDGASRSEGGDSAYVAVRQLLQ